MYYSICINRSNWHCVQYLTLASRGPPFPIHLSEQLSLHTAFSPARYKTFKPEKLYFGYIKILFPF